MPKIKQTIEKTRGKKSGFGRLSWDDFERILKTQRHLTEQQRIVEVTIDEDGIQYQTKTSEK